MYCCFFINKDLCLVYFKLMISRSVPVWDFEMGLIYRPALCSYINTLLVRAWRVHFEQIFRQKLANKSEQRQNYFDLSVIIIVKILL